MRTFKSIQKLFLILSLIFGQCITLFSAENSYGKMRKSGLSDRTVQLSQFKSDDNNDTDDDDDDKGKFCITGLFLNVGWSVTKFLLLSPSFDSTRFNAFPYAEQKPGMIITHASTGYRQGYGQVLLHYHYVNDDLYGIILTARGRLNNIAGISLDISRYQEKRKNQSDDSMTMVRLGVIKSLGIRERLIWDLDLGIRLISMSAGFDAGMRFQIFPKSPFVIEIWGSAGLMEREFFAELKPMVGIMTGRFQWEMGYRFLKWNDNDLKGGLAGVRIWF